jgi:hypothetical protein
VELNDRLFYHNKEKNLFEFPLEMIRINKEFKNVAYETMYKEAQMEKRTLEDHEEKKLFDKEIRKIENIDSIKNLKWLIKKGKVMKHVRPTLFK